MVLLVGSLVVRHVERLTGALVASGTIEAPPASPPPGTERRQRRVDGAVDLDGSQDDADDADDTADVVEHKPGVR